STRRRSTRSVPRWLPAIRSRLRARAWSPPRPGSWPSVAVAARWCRSAPPAAWAWWPSSSAEPVTGQEKGGRMAASFVLRRSIPAGRAGKAPGSVRQQRDAVRAAFFGRERGQRIQRTCRQRLHRLAAGNQQRIGVGLAGRHVVAGFGQAVAQQLPCVRAGATGQGLVEQGAGLVPLALLPRQARGGHQQRRAGRVLLQPALGAGT